MAFIPGQLAVALKVAFANTDPFEVSPTYTDITSYVSRSAGDFDPATYGGSDLVGTAEPGSLLIPLRNQDGRFDPANAASPYAGNLLADRRVLWQVGGTTRFDGYVDSWVPSDNLDGRAICWLRAVCPLGLLARYTLRGVGLADFALKVCPSPPSSYFRLGDKDGIELYDEVRQRSGGQYHDRRNRITSRALTDPDSAAALASPVAAFLGINGDLAPTGGGAFAVALIVETSSLPATSTTNTIWELGALNLYVTDTGALALIGPGIAVAGPTITTGAPHAVTVRRQSNGTSYTIGAQVAPNSPQTTTSGSGSGYTIPAGAPLYVGGGPNAGGPDLPGGVVDELMIWRTVDPGDSNLADISNRMVYGWPSSNASIRSAASSRLAGFPAGRHVALAVDPQLDTPLDGSDLPSGDLLRDAQKIAASVGGDFFSRPDGVLYHRGYRIPAVAPTPVLVFDDALGTTDLRYSSFESTQAFTDKRTVVTVTDGVTTGEAVSGSAGAESLLSAIIYQRRASLAADRHTAVIAARRLRRLATQAPRIRFSVDLGRLTTGQRSSVLSSLAVGALVKVTHRPPDGAARTYFADVTRTVDRWVQPGTYRIDVEARPYPSIYPTFFRRTQQGDVSVGNNTDHWPLGQLPRFDTDGHAGPFGGVDVGLLSGPTDADPSVYLVGGSGYWQDNTTGYRGLFMVQGWGDATNWAANVDSPAGTSSIGTTQGLVTLVRKADVAALSLRARQSSGGALQFWGSGFPDTNAAFAPDIWGVRIPTGNHAARVTNNANQSIPDNAATTITYNAERFDPAGLHSTSSNTDRITPTRTGTYLVGVNGAYAVDAADTTRSRRFATSMGGNDRGRFDFFGTTVELGCGWVVSLERITSLAGSPFFRSNGRIKHSGGSALNLTTQSFFSPEFWVVECTGPAARMRKTDSASIGTGYTTWTQVQTFGQVDFDDGLIVGNELVLTEDGPWFVYGSAEYALNSTGSRGLQVVRGSHEVVGRTITKSSGAPMCIQVAALVDGKAGDTFKLETAHDAGVSLTMSGFADYACVFAAVKVSRGG